jgi:hypothetical protein
VTRLIAAPIDELAKALPVLAVVALFRSWRHLTISDYVLIGVAGGLGYEFLNWSLAIVTGVDPHIWHSYLFGSLALAALPAYFVGAISAAFVGLVAGATLRLNPRRLVVIGLALLAVLVAAFDNAMFRWQTGALLSYFRPIYRAPLEVLSYIHALLLNGRLELWLLIGGVLIANWLEGRWARTSAPAGQDKHLLEDDARIAFVPVEWLVAARYLQCDWPAFARIDEYFRTRRAYMLVSAEARRSPSESALNAAALALARKLTTMRAALARPPEIRALNRSAIAKLAVRWANAHRLELVAGLMFVLWFMIPPNGSLLLKSVLFSDWLVLLTIAGAGVLLFRRRMTAQEMPPASLPEAHLFAVELDAWLGRLAFIAALLALAVYFVPPNQLLANYTATRVALVDPFELWAGGGESGDPVYGGNPHTFFAAAALILCCAARWRQRHRSTRSLTELTGGHLAAAGEVKGG